MRTISQSALNKILTKEGTDPITLVQIYWTETTYIIYGDRAFTPEVKGQLLDVGDIENVINANQGSNSGSVSIRLNDTEGDLKTIFNTMDIHKRPVYILQWFPEIPLTDAFIVFDGVITTPVTWKEGERTISFDVISKIEDLEIGFSAEEGNFDYIPPNIIGKAWPMVYGTALRVPALQINEAPNGNSNEDTGIDGATGDGTNDNPLTNIDNNEKKNLTLLEELERECFLMAAILLGNADSLNRSTPGGGDLFNRRSDNPVAQQLYDLGTQYETKGNEYHTERMTPINTPNNNNNTSNDSNKALEKNQVTVSGGYKFPQNQMIVITINGAPHEGYFEGNVFTIVSRTHPFTDQQAVVAPTEIIDRAVATEYKTTMAAQTFFYAIAGSIVTLSNSGLYPIYYIVGIPHLTNILVQAYRAGAGSTKFVVPSSYYSISYVTFGNLQATILTMFTPLSTRKDWGSDDIWVNCTSPVGPNAVDILKNVINNYTNQSWDATTFNEVHTLVNPYKCGFALLDRRNAMQVIQEISYQSRCAVWFKGGRFFLKYLPKQGTPTETFTEDDVESGTMEVVGTDSEDLVTKWTVTWRPRLDLEPPYRIIYRYHITKYGAIEASYDCYIYNNKNSVEKFALFWMIRQSNTWKKIRFSTFLTKLRVEPFDSVLLDFTYPWINDPDCIKPTVGIVEQASYNSENQRIEMLIWVPIRFGEMCPYDFAYPGDLDKTYVYPVEKDPGIQTDVPGSKATGPLYDQKPLTGAGSPSTTPPNSGSGGGVPVSDQEDQAKSDLGEFNPPTELNPADLVNTGNPPTNKTVSQRLIKPIDIQSLDVPDASFPGKVVKQVDGTKYKVTIYLNGLANPGKEIEATQMQIDNDDIIEPDTRVIVLRNVQRNDKGLVENIEYTMQVPIWLKPKDEEQTGFGGDLDPSRPSDPGTPTPEPVTTGGDFGDQ